MQKNIYFTSRKFKKSKKKIKIRIGKNVVLNYFEIQMQNGDTFQQNHLLLLILLCLLQTGED